MSQEYTLPPFVQFPDGLDGNYHISPEDLALEKEAEERSNRIIGKWEVYTLEDAYKERPPRKYLIDGLLPYPSLSIVFGGPGSLKSMLLADMCMCVALGKKWLEPLPGDKNKGITLLTNSASILWIDFDNGRDRSHERFEAAGRAHDVPADYANVRYVSMPTPWLDASNRELIIQLAELIKHLGAKLVVIDNLGLITGDVEENSGKMAQVMGHLRWLCEECECAVIVVHHQRKSSGASNDKGVRKGEMLRGHSSIEASLDLALLVERKEGSDSVAVIPTKVRGFKEYDAIGARFAYEHKPGTKDLALARFFADAVMSVEEAVNLKIANTIKNVLIAGALNSKELVEEVRVAIAKEPGGKAPPIHKIRGIIKDLAEQGEIDDRGDGATRLYSHIRRPI